MYREKFNSLTIKIYSYKKFIIHLKNQKNNIKINSRLLNKKLKIKISYRK